MPSVTVHLVGAALAAVIAGCGAPGSPAAPPPVPEVRDDPPVDLIASAQALFDQYELAITAGHREALPTFYHPDGAVRVINGIKQRLSYDALRRGYVESWTPPAFFAWDRLTFDPVAANQVLVTGWFRIYRTGRTDTTRVTYAALVATVDSGVAIVFEHETERPTR